MRKIAFCLVVVCAAQLNGVCEEIIVNTSHLELVDSMQVKDSLNGTFNEAAIDDKLNKNSIKGDTLTSAERDSLIKSVRGIHGNTSRENTAADSSLVVQKKQKSPRMAGLLSASLPGLGQVYNRGWKGWWKVAIIYGGGYLLVRNIALYSKTQNFYHGALVIHDQDTTPEVIKSDLEKYRDGYKNIDDYTTLTGAQFASLQQGEIKVAFEDYRSNVQNLYVFTALLYGLNILDAVVDAHLRTFDVSDDLTMRIKPSVLNMNGAYHGLGPAVSVKFSLK